MTDVLKFQKNSPRVRLKLQKWKKYFLLSIICNTCLGLLAFTYLKFKEPTYVSNWTITLPGARSSTALQLPNIGQTSIQEQSPFNHYFDPREIYKYIALSEPVLLDTADKLGIPLEELKKPKIKIIDNTTLMSFEVEGMSPEKAQSAALAFSQAFKTRLRELRIEEGEIQNSPLKSQLNTARQKLDKAQEQLSRYKYHSGFNSETQIVHLSSSIEQLRKEQALIFSQKKQSETTFAELSKVLKLSIQQATEAFILQSDPTFQELIKDYGESSTNLVSLNSKYQPNNPAVVNNKERLDFIQKALLNRAKSLLNKTVSLNYVDLLSVDNSPPRQELIHNLVSNQVEKQGLITRYQEIEQQIFSLEQKLQELTQHQLIVENLQRDEKIAEAIFSSTLTSLELDKSENFSSYPRIQLISDPTLPLNPAWPDNQIILIGTILGSCFITSGLLLLGLRNHSSLSNL